jgi:MscS family membrane protein
MNQLLQQKILDNSIQAYLIVLGTIFITLIFKRLISKFLASKLFKLISNSKHNLPKQSFLDLVVQPLGTFLLLTISMIAIDKLKFPGAFDFSIYKTTSRQLLESLMNGALVLVFIWLCLRIIDFMAVVLEERANVTKDQQDNQLIIFFKDFFKVILIIVAALLVLKFSFNKNIGNILTGLSLVGAAVALATRESMENLIASFIIFFDKPFMVGEQVKVNGFIGTIEKIGLRSTRIRTNEKTYISVPNKQMVDTIVDNISLRTQRTTDIQLELSLSATAAELAALLASIRSLFNTQKIGSSHVYLQDTGKHAHIIAIQYFSSATDELEDYFLLREKINMSLINILETHKIELAASSMDVVVKR